MAIMDFGQIASALQAGMQANAARDIGPISTGVTVIGTVDYDTGNMAEASIQAQTVIGSTNEFLWGIHTWDDGENKVV